MFQAPVRENISEVLFSLLCLNEKEKSRSPYGLRDFGAVGEIRTLVPVLPATRFPVVLVMTTSIPLRIAMLNSESYYIRNRREVKP